LKEIGVPVVKQVAKNVISVTPLKTPEVSPYKSISAGAEIIIHDVWPKSQGGDLIINVKEDTEKWYPYISAICSHLYGVGLEHSSLFVKRGRESVIQMDSVDTYLAENVAQEAVVASAVLDKDLLDLESTSLPPPLFLDIGGRVEVTLESPEFAAPTTLDFLLDGNTIYATRDIGYRHWRSWLKTREDAYTLSPYERNSVFWSELWKALCMSDTIILVVAANNIELFYNPYMTQVKKLIDSRRGRTISSQHFVLVNKCDLLTETQFKMIAESFSADNVEFLPYSSKQPEKWMMTAAEVIEKLGPVENRSNVAMIGYPNVGKSSVINSLLGVNKCSVSATAGKTKSIASYPLDENITLIDVPGFVQATIMNNPSRLLIDGVLNLDQDSKKVIECATCLLNTIGFREFLVVVKAPITDKGLELERRYNDRPQCPLVIEATLDYVNQSVFKFLKSGRGGNTDNYKLMRKILKMIRLEQLVMIEPPKSVDTKKFKEAGKHIIDPTAIKLRSDDEMKVSPKVIRNDKKSRHKVLGMTNYEIEFI